MSAAVEARVCPTAPVLAGCRLSRRSCRFFSAARRGTSPARGRRPGAREARRPTAAMAAGSSSGWGSGTPYSGGISTAAASAAKVRSAALKRSPHRYGRPSASRSRDVVEDRAHLGLGLRRGGGRDVEVAVDHARDQRVRERQGAALPGRDAGARVGDRDIATPAQAVVHPPSPVRSQAFVEVALERPNLGGGARIVGKQPPIRRRRARRPHRRCRPSRPAPGRRRRAPARSSRPRRDAPRPSG